MKNQKSPNRTMTIVGVACLLSSLVLYILAIINGSNALFACGIVFAIIGVIPGRKTDNPLLIAACVVLALANGLELFMRLRDGYTGKGWYYFYLLQHPEKNAWH